MQHVSLEFPTLYGWQEANPDKAPYTVSKPADAPGYTSDWLNKFWAELGKLLSGYQSRGDEIESLKEKLARENSTVVHLNDSLETLRAQNQALRDRLQA